MGEWPVALGASRNTDAGSVTTSSRGTIITGSASLNTKGTYTELIASTAHPVDGVTVMSNGTGASAATGLLDVAIGAAGSEVVVLSNLLILRPSQSMGAMMHLPIRLPAGVRVAARLQGSIASLGHTFSVMLHAAPGARWGFPGHGVCDTYGAVTATSQGTTLDPGGSANTKGAWAQLTASTTRPIRWLGVAIGGNATFTRAAVANHLVDIGIGGAGSEQVVVPNLAYRIDTGPDVYTPPFVSMPVSIPAGQRLAARCSSSVTTATERLMDIVVYGVA